MPGAADALADHQSLGQRSMIMAAMRVDGEDVRPRAHQQNVFLADMAEQGLAGEFGQLDAQRQIRSGRWGLFISHVLLPRELSSFSFGSITIGSAARQMNGCKSSLIGHSTFTLIRRRALFGVKLIDLSGLVHNLNVVTVGVEYPGCVIVRMILELGPVQFSPIRLLQLQL